MSNLVAFRDYSSRNINEHLDEHGHWGMQATEDCGRGVTGEGLGQGGLLKAKVGLESGPLSLSSASSGCKHHPYNRVHVSISITISGHWARGIFLTKGFPEFYYQGHVFAPFSQGLQPAQLQVRRSRESVVVCCCGHPGLSVVSFPCPLSSLRLSLHSPLVPRPSLSLALTLQKLG